MNIRYICDNRDKTLLDVMVYLMNRGYDVLPFTYLDDCKSLKIITEDGEYTNEECFKFLGEQTCIYHLQDKSIDFRKNRPEFKRTLLPKIKTE